MFFPEQLAFERDLALGFLGCIDAHAHSMERSRRLVFFESVAENLPDKIGPIKIFDLGVALYHGEFAVVSAGMEHNGVPIDREIFSQLADKNTWRAVRDDMVPEIDAQYGVYVRDRSGNWTFNMERFEAYLARAGIGWPRLETGEQPRRPQLLILPRQLSPPRNTPPMLQSRGLRRHRRRYCCLPMWLTT